MSALRQLIAENPNLLTYEKETVRNRLTDPVWFFKKSKDKAHSVSTEIEVNFVERFGNLSAERELWVKQILMPSNKCWQGVDGTQGAARQLKDGTILVSESLLKKRLKSIKSLLRSLENKAMNLRDMNASELAEFWKDTLKIESRGRQKYAGFRSEEGVKEMFLFLQKLTHSFHRGDLTDGPNALLTPQFALHDSIVTVGSSMFDDFDYATWKRGGNFGGLPVYQSIAILMSCLDLISSDKAKFAIAWARFRGRVSGSLQTNYLYEGRLADYGWNRGSEKQQIMHEELTTVFNGKTLQEIRELNLVNKFQPAQKGNAKNSEFALLLRDIPRACVTAFAILAGARRNELGSIDWEDIVLNDDGNWQFRSEINKTNHGVATLRYIGGPLADIVNTLRLLQGVVNPEFSGAIFRGVKPSGKLTANQASEDSVKALGSFIDSRINPILGDDLKIYDFNIHSVRHAWAEFALRRFEGDSVPELIRDHFRHSFDSYMTKRYTHGKLDEEDSLNPQREYLKEIIGRLLDSDGQEDFFGPVADFIKELADGFEFIGEDEIEDIFSKFEGTIEPHEYGFCVVRPETVTTAQCYNKVTRLAETTEACWEKCGGCVNRLTLGSQREDIVRIGQSIAASIKSFESAGLIHMVDAYKPALKRAQQALKEMDQEKE